MIEGMHWKELAKAGEPPLVVAQAAHTEEASLIEVTRVLRETYGLDLVGAQGIWFEAIDGRSLEEHQEDLLPGLQQALGDDEG